MSGVHQVDNWKVSVGTRNNLLYSDIPHVPILVEDIPIHFSFEDYEENSIKTIQTLGELIPKTEIYATLLSLTPGNNSEFPVSFKNLSITDLYTKNPDNTYCAIWEKYTVFKVYGSLRIEKSVIVLETSHLVPINDVSGTWKLMISLIPTARSEYRRYYRTQGQNNMLQSQWDKMKEEKKRLVNETTL
ncbi:uncharacterized protein LOC143347155 [Colletes latitarsis]|uniref:uncharacterized protein LOC143347155 n=1 Tax=Colletes latitarsis TaxID=2605962 RepID=UPI004035786F